jgi:hypothetical protein
MTAIREWRMAIWQKSKHANFSLNATALRELLHWNNFFNLRSGIFDSVSVTRSRGQLAFETAFMCNLADLDSLKFTDHI